MAIIGAILGDIAGSKWEFNRPKDLDYEHIRVVFLQRSDVFLTVKIMKVSSEMY